MTRYVALLRGINVGGKNLIRMSDLQACFEKDGFRAVRTFIQSGNVLFEASGSAAELTRRIEALLTRTFGFEASVVLRSRRQMGEIVDGAPKGFGARPDLYRYDVLFLRPSVTAAAALPRIPAREGVDELRAGKGVIYASRLVRRLTQSRLGRLAALPLYRELTIRNWNTTTRLRDLLDQAGGRTNTSA